MASTTAISTEPPSTRIEDAAASRRGRLRPARNSRAPSRANTRAAAAPTDPPPPWITATLSSSSMLDSFIHSPFWLNVRRWGAGVNGRGWTVAALLFEDGCGAPAHEVPATTEGRIRGQNHREHVHHARR